MRRPTHKTGAAIKQKLPVIADGYLLTERERDALRIISLGGNKMAAQKLAISPSTVRTYVESMFRKLECPTQAAGR
ncbi:response regulator transcription factor [Lysobacter sp. CA196]|uniref:response regulator transcription factor n=1 Tax=Lysobacter sp. CA196 TaxID=3455606 RepID=UPI003F8D4D13